MMYIGGADIVANKPMLFFDLVLFFSFIVIYAGKMYKNSQWPECERHKHFIHNEYNALFMLTYAKYRC